MSPGSARETAASTSRIPSVLDPGPTAVFADRFEYDGSAKGLHRPLVGELTPDRFQKE